ncbi:MAG: ABC transporter permease subunit [Anaerolineales bacterium]|nr:ABC transporter permease subunit [Anaerolineales bacterium]
MKKKRSLLRSIAIFVAIIAAILIYALAFSVTDVDFEATRSEERLTQLTRIIRALAHPDIIEYDQDEVDVEVPYYLPCQEAGEPEITVDQSGPYLVVDPPCAGPKDFVTINGFNFTPGTRGPVNFIPPSGAKLQIGNFEVDEAGKFTVKTELPNRQPVEEAQAIRATSRMNVGSPRLSPLALSTIDKIIETVFLALLATTFGTLLAIFISFLAARNLMEDVKSPLTSIALMLLGWTVGIGIGLQLARWIGQTSENLSENNLIVLAGILISALVIWLIIKWAVPPEELEQPKLALRITRMLALAVAAVLALFAMNFIAYLGFAFGTYLADNLGTFGFMGNFIYQLSDILRMLTPALAALAAGGVLGSFGGRIGHFISDRWSPNAVKLTNVIISALAGAAVFVLVGAFIDWLYQLGDLTRTFFIPAAVGAILGIALALWVTPKRALPIGSVIYTITRTLLNATRSIEPLIYVIIFVVWVGIGPFAGALALGLHTTAALSKLYSEQVESILPGPLEAVTATGANRIQMIAYAVVPQIVTPYISFTMYRWDINVRMSTIIGFAGGGGIGFLLQQNIRLLDYRAASTQMIAIAIVVATMDYTSSALRKRFV